MDNSIPKIISDGIEDVLIPGTLGLSLTEPVMEVKSREPVNPRALLDDVVGLSKEMDTSKVSFDKLIDVVRHGGTKSTLTDACLKAYYISQMWNQISNNLVEMRRALGMPELKIK